VDYRICKKQQRYVGLRLEPYDCEPKSIEQNFQGDHQKVESNSWVTESRGVDVREISRVRNIEAVGELVAYDGAHKAVHGSEAEELKIVL
jgi:hypothetical protein